MKRRDALKHIGLTAGFVVATPTIVSLLQSCSNNTEPWTPIFLTEEQGIVLNSIVDVILPKTDTPSALEVNAPEFIDKYINEVLDIEDQDKLKAGFTDLITLLKVDYKSNLNELSENDYKDLLDNHMLLNEDPTPETEAMTISDLLHYIKSMSISAYLTNEKIGETVLKYDPVPSAYYCGDLDELTGGKSWSLGIKTVI